MSKMSAEMLRDIDKDTVDWDPNFDETRREPPVLPARFRGRPELHPERCAEGCAACLAVCPSGALSLGPLRLDLGRCTFCGRCAEACPSGALTFTREYALATRSREDLVLEDQAMRLAEALDARGQKLFGRSLKLRQVSAGGCNACEADVNVLTTVGWDLGRFGIQFVASPRHADGILVTGPVTQNMAYALRNTYDAITTPKLVIVVGSCSISGGLFRDNPETLSGLHDIPIDLYIPGCPPHPLTMLDGLLRLLDRLPPPSGNWILDIDHWTLDIESWL